VSSERNHLSILRNISASDVQSDPYPHVIIRQALPDDIYKDIENSFPDLSSLYQGDPEFGSKSFTAFGNDILERDDISDTWRSFLDYHMTKPFFDDFVRVFGDHINSSFPDLEQILNTRISNFKVVTRDAETARIRQTQSQDSLKDADHDVAMSTGVNVGFTIDKARIHLDPHLDRTYKLFSSLLYMRDPMDTSTGGDLVIYRLKDQSRLRKKGVIYTSHGRHFNDDIVEEVNRVPYEENMAVVFINSRNAIHGVSLRTPTSIPRRYVYINAEVSKVAGFHSCMDDQMRHPINRVKRAIKKFL
jgi:hypothetical protein